MSCSETRLCRRRTKTRRESRIFRNRDYTFPEPLAHLRINVQENKELAISTGCAFVGYTWNIYKLAVKEGINDHATEVANVQRLTTKFQNVITADMLWEHTTLKPLFRNVARCSSRSHMI